MQQSRFSAIARSVMISASKAAADTLQGLRFSAIARSVMISATLEAAKTVIAACFSAIARSVMISALDIAKAIARHEWFQCYSS